MLLSEFGWNAASKIIYNILKLKMTQEDRHGRVSARGGFVGPLEGGRQPAEARGILQGRLSRRGYRDSTELGQKTEDNQDVNECVRVYGYANVCGASKFRLRSSLTGRYSFGKQTFNPVLSCVRPWTT